jgi:MFS family permease
MSAVLSPAARPPAGTGESVAAREPRPPAAAPFLAGVLVSQIANNALHLAQPLLIIELSKGSLAVAGAVASAETAVHMSATFLGGSPADRLGSRRLLVLSTALRGLSLAAIPALWLTGLLTLKTALCAYTLDAVVRGFVDTSAHALPLELCGPDAAALDKLNSGFEAAFDLGGVLGPLLMGALMLKKQSLGLHAAIPAGFLLAAATFALLPKGRRDGAAGPRGAETPRGGTREGLRAILADRSLLFLAASLAMLNLYPLRKLISVFFAKAILHSPSAAAAVAAAFGLGGVAGAAVFARRGARLPGWAWVGLGGAGVMALAVGWIPGALAPMLAACFLFAFTNGAARLVMTRRLQEATPEHAIGGVTAVARSGSNLVSVVLKGLMGAAFAAGGGIMAAFAMGGAGLASLALVQLALALKLRADGAHKMRTTR